jgi:hypothetical protein
LFIPFKASTATKELNTKETTSGNKIMQINGKSNTNKKTQRIMKKIQTQ